MTDFQPDRRSVWLGLLGSAASMGLAPTAIADVVFSDTNKVFRLDGGGVTYAFGINAKGQVQALYWGGALTAGDVLPQPTVTPDHSSNEVSVTLTPQEFAGFGGGLTTEPALKVRFPDGVRDLDLHYDSHKVTDGQLAVKLKDISRAVYVILTYVMDRTTGILARSAVVENRTRSWIQVDQMAAAALSLPFAEDYQLTYLTGRWAAEWTLQTRAITPGATVLESRRGITSHQSNPWIAISRADTTEDNGPVWFGALGWSGSWRITVDMDAMGGVRATAGYNPFDFEYRLKAGETLASPTFYVGFSPEGFGGASRIFHRFQRGTILPGAPTPRLRPVLYNSWEATQFAVDEPGQMALAEKAAGLGVERFVMDDGWFGARNSDHAGLGDWTVNPKKFPNGLGPLIKRVNELGMEFGLWVEPEMVNPDSDLYRAHPDWVINFPTRPRSEARNQLVLNLARRDVYAYLLNTLDKLVSDNNIAFLKWDQNRNWSEPGWPQMTADDEPKLYVDYVRNLYALMAELRRRHPKLEIESCASGGGRVDLGILKLTDQVWVSDNTDPYDRLTMQDGFSHAYPPAVMMAWVTDSPSWVNRRSTSLEYRFLSAMQGGLGIGANLNDWKSDDFATAKSLIAEYKAFRATIQHGDLYRLMSPRNGSERSATLSVSPDKRQAILFAFLHSSTELNAQPFIQLRGLEPQAMYSVRAISGKFVQQTPSKASGAYWMAHGLMTDMVGDFQAAAFAFDV